MPVHVGVGFDRDLLADDAFGGERAASNARREILDHDARFTRRSTQRGRSCALLGDDRAAVRRRHEAHLSSRHDVVGCNRRATPFGQVVVDDDECSPRDQFEGSDGAGRTGEPAQPIARLGCEPVDQRKGIGDVGRQG